MITFVSLYLWLVIGVQTVEVAVDPGVDRVDILLDGKPAATMSGEPWKAKVDFGPLLAPRELTAVAYDEEGGELSRPREFVRSLDIRTKEIL